MARLVTFHLDQPTVSRHINDSYCLNAPVCAPQLAWSKVNEKFYYGTVNMNKEIVTFFQTLNADSVVVNPSFSVTGQSQKKA